MAVLRKRQESVNSKLIRDVTGQFRTHADRSIRKVGISDVQPDIVRRSNLQALRPNRLRGLAWLGLALVARHRGITKEKTLQSLLKNSIESRDVRRGLDNVVSGLKSLDLEEQNA
jgi:hypothetical protein